jgi:ribosomal protein L24
MSVSKTSYLAKELRGRGFDVYTHSTLPGRLCVKAKNTVVIREAWPSSHGNCFINAVFVPPEDQTSSTPRVAIPGWYRAKHGRYRGDIAFGQSYDSRSDKITLLVASRDTPPDDVGLGKDSRTRRLFNSPSYEQTNDHRKESYTNGLLSLILDRTAVVHIPIPAPVDISLHQESMCAPAFVGSTLHAYAAKHWMEGDAVQVIAGEMISCRGKIECVDTDNWLASVYMDESLQVEHVSSRPFMFPIANLVRLFSVGDNVCVLEGSIVPLELRGKTGAVVAIDASTVEVYDMSSQSQVSDPSCFPIITDVDIEFIVGIDSLATWSADISKPSPTSPTTDDGAPMKGDYALVIEGPHRNEEGKISEVDKMNKSLTFISRCGTHQVTVPVKETAFNICPTAIRYTRERGYDVVAGDTVRVVRGERLDALGPVLHVNLEDQTLTLKDTPLTEVRVHQYYLTAFNCNTHSSPPP